MRRATAQGFTLIELLTVIAIIAVIAAIAFPVFGRVRENARQATCMSNMQQLYVGLGLYRDDSSGEFPTMLLGPAESAPGVPAISGAAMPIQQTRGFLFPQYVRDIESFTCPNNPSGGGTEVVTVDFAPGPPGTLTGPATFGALGFTGVSAGGFNYDANAGTPIPLHATNSYDLTSRLGGGSRQLVYSRDWTGTAGLQDAPNQMKYRNPPLDKVVVTWCNYHATVSGAGVSPVLLATGTTRRVDAQVVQQRGWALAN
ncbi:MAG TPA: prepilin-type N-terminal cleavage/methylation domain-containing protein [Chthonomonadales bacterium]|nr:prepilin-type N-terminal cleavage/methylation domain-containing protein [Chthonomonadales bacterium]